MKYAFLNVLVFELLLCTQVCSQEFSIRQAGEFNSAGTAVMELEDGFITVVAALDSIDGEFFSSTIINRVSSTGDILVSNQLGTPDWICQFNQDAIAELNDGTFVIAARTMVDEVWAARIIQFDQNCDTLQTSFIYSPSYTGDPEEYDNWMTPMYLVNDGEDHLYLTAQTTSSGSGNNFCIFRLNSNGEVDWHFLYEPDHENDICYALAADSDGVYVCAGSQNDPEEDEVSNEYFLRLNPDGILVYEHLNQEGINASIPQECFLTPEGLVIVSAIDDSIAGHNASIYKTDFENELLWMGYVGNEGYRSGFQSIVEDCNGGYTCSGVEDVYNVLDSTQGPENQLVILVNFDAAGNINWTRKFMFLEVPIDEHRMRDLRHTSDGGYIMIGEATDMTNGEDWIPELPRQQTWLLKVDGCGCLIPGCDPLCEEEECDITHINESDEIFQLGKQNGESGLIVFIDHWKPENLQVTLHDELGRLLYSFETKNGTTYIVPTSRFSSGMYVVSLISENKVLQSKKFWKE